MSMSAPIWSDQGQTTIPRVLREAVRRWPDRSSLDFAGECASYSDLDRESNRLARGLAALGLRKGETICTMIDTSLDYMYLFYAIARLGAINVPINTSYRGEFLRHQIADTGAKIVIAESDYAERVVALADALPELRTLIYRGERSPVSSRLEVRSLDSIRSDQADPVDVDVHPGDIALLIYTSGTTGPSKGCMVPHASICNNARQLSWVLELTENDTYWTPLPLFHMNGISAGVIGTVLVGARCAVATRFSLSGFWPEVYRTGATAACLIGSMIVLVANAEDTEMSRKCRGQFRAVFGAPFPESIKAIWRDRFGVRHVGQSGYGMTETTMLTAVQLSEDTPAGTSGRRWPEFDMRIVDDEGNECPPGVPGEIIARPLLPNLMFKGYWHRPEETLQVMRDLWFWTGDIGKMDADGYFSFVDRKKDYLRRGGENISSFEMESTFRSHPAIQDVAVHAVFSELTEDDVKVTAVLKPGESVTEEELCRWSIDRVPHFAVPRYIEFRADLPRNQVGRILKYELRAEGVTPATWDRSKSSVTVSRR